MRSSKTTTTVLTATNRRIVARSLGIIIAGRQRKGEIKDVKGKNTAI